MFSKFVQLCGLISALCLMPAINAFWWPRSTTQPPTTLLKQIPLTYFRTYTYQPLAGNPFSFPFFGFGAAQTPLLTSARYDSFATAAANYPSTLLDASKALPLHSGIGTTTVAAAPTTTTTSTTTTTTSTPPPTTTTSTSSTTTTTTTTAAPPTSTKSTLPAAQQYQSEYPTYNRRVYANNNNFMRPQYPYPDYFNYQPVGGGSVKGNTVASSSGSASRIQFVPCMCPISVSLSAASPVSNGVTNAASKGGMYSLGDGSGIDATSEPLQARTGDDDSYENDADEEPEPVDDTVQSSFKSEVTEALPAAENILAFVASNDKVGEQHQQQEMEESLEE